MSANTLFISAEILKKRTPIHDNIDAKLLQSDIKIAQDMYIHPILGTALFKKIQDDIADGTITGAYKSLLDDYIIDCLCWYVLIDSVTTLSFQLANKGLVRKNGENIDMPSMSDMIDISNKYKAKAEFYATRLSNYLEENASQSLFPEYLNPGTGCDTIKPDKENYTCPVFLD